LKLRNLSNATNEELASGEVGHIWLYELHVDGSTILRFARSNEDYVWNTNTYLKSAIKHSQVTSGTDGQLNDVTISLADESNNIAAWVRTNELVGCKLRIIEVFTTNLDSISVDLVIKSISISKGVVTLTLNSGFDIFKAKVPGRYAMSNHCSWIFSKDLPAELVGTELDCCQYSGSDTECRHTFEDCRSKGNYERFGGFPAIRSTWLTNF
jgi:phage-related protein